MYIYIDKLEGISSLQVKYIIILCEFFCSFFPLTKISRVDGIKNSSVNLEMHFNHYKTPHVMNKLHF